jgi:hypothetical protein
MPSRRPNLQGFLPISRSRKEPVMLGLAVMRSFLLVTLLGAVAAACGGTASAPKSSPPSSPEERYEDGGGELEVPYDFDSQPHVAPAPASLDAHWWEDDAPCPVGADLVGGVPPEFDRVGCESKKGKNEGRHTRFFSGGGKREEGSFASHFAEGVWTEWDESGWVVSVTPYQSGNKEGEETVFYADGVIKSQRHYSQGERHGLTVIWDERERKRTILNYENGKKDGPEARYDIEGYLVRVIEWDQGVQISER